MSKVHPLFIILLLAIVALFLHNKSEQKQETLIQQAKKQTLAHKEAKEIQSLQSQWNDAGEKMRKIFNSPAFQSADIQSKESSQSITYTIDNLDAFGLQTFGSRVLNNAVALQRLQIERTGENNATVILEVGR